MSNKLGEQLRAARHAAGLTLAQVCDRARINISTLSQIERGLLRGSIAVVERLAKVYGLEVVVSLRPVSADEEAGNAVEC